MTRLSQLLVKAQRPQKMLNILLDTMTADAEEEKKSLMQKTIKDIMEKDTGEYLVEEKGAYSCSIVFFFFHFIF